MAQFLLVSIETHVGVARRHHLKYELKGLLLPFFLPLISKQIGGSLNSQPLLSHPLLLLL